jgi:ParB family transcriptional regulator, chromosome partitioning protein
MNSANDNKQRKALGKGLSALLPSRSAPAAAAAAPAPEIRPEAQPSTTDSATAHPTSLPVDAIHPNPMQPRTVFQPDRLQELAASIRSNGIIQPLIVRETGGGYQIVAGERRWRAARLAGLSDVPVVVQEVADRLLLEVALVENIQREDLNPIETAHAYERLARDLGLSQEEIGQRTGKDRASIANTLRLLKLPTEVQLLLAEHRLTMGHAKAILGLTAPEEQIRLAEKAAAQGLSVRQVEALVQEEAGEPRSSKARKDSHEDPNVRAAVEALELALGTRVRIVALSEQRGRFEIEYYSPAERDRIYSHLTGG